MININFFRASNLPLLVDIDTGFGGALNIKRTIQEVEAAGVAGIHIEDQVMLKRCGHRPGKVNIYPTSSRYLKYLNFFESKSLNVARWWIASSARWQRDKIQALSSWPEPTHWQAKVFIRESLNVTTSSFLGMESALKRTKAYVEAGADMVFPEALTELQQYREFTTQLPNTPGTPLLVSCPIVLYHTLSPNQY